MGWFAELLLKVGEAGRAELHCRAVCSLVEKKSAQTFQTKLRVSSWKWGKPAASMAIPVPELLASRLCLEPDLPPV